MLVNEQKEEEKVIRLGISVLEIEARAISELSKRINHAFFAACRALLNCVGRVVVAGMGKSGHVGKKIAATLASTGTPSFFLHPAEASHGDLGMITNKDAILILSYSGETDEILTILPLIKRLDIPIIAMTSNNHSTLAKFSDVHLDISVRKEACPLGLAPTASTTSMLAMGDALALAVLEMRGFTADDFALAHPGGQLGRRLLLKVADVMRTGTNIPKVTETAQLSEALIEMSGKRLGFTTVVSSQDPRQLIGIFTDGDLRRTLNAGINVHKTTIQEVMTKNCKTIKPTQLATEAIALMEKVKILILPVIDEQGRLVGALDMHDLFRAQVI
jgi:arabinose-5-phosphate isomerase